MVDTITIYISGAFKAQCDAAITQLKAWKVPTLNIIDISKDYKQEWLFRQKFADCSVFPVIVIDGDVIYGYQIPPVKGAPLIMDPDGQGWWAPTSTTADVVEKTLIDKSITYTK